MRGVQRVPWCGVVLLLSAACGSGGCSQPGPAGDSTGAVLDGGGSYAVVVSRATYEQPDWREVVDALRQKHQAAVVVYGGDVAESRSELGRIMPRYACFVARPEEAGRAFVVSVQRLTRRLDDDPYTDVIWGILTGYEAADALRIAELKKPLIVRRALAGCGVDLNAFDEGIKFSEGMAGERFVKRPGEPERQEAWAPDSTEGLVQGFIEFQPDIFYTSGHATERDWQIGYNYPDGSFRCEAGQLYGRDTQGRRFDIRSPNPKVYLPMGNCLIGHVSGRDCMATALMRSAGVSQMVGYTVVTFYGFMGWGTNDYFEGQRDFYTLAESFFAIQQALLHQLETRHTRLRGIEFDRFEAYDIEGLAAEHQLRERDEVGLLWDRDTVAFYGDPAWEVRRMPGDRGWREEWHTADGLHTLRIIATRDGQWPPRPIIVFLPRRLQVAGVTHGEELAPVLADNFVLLPLSGACKNGEVKEVRFRAKELPVVTTSAREAPTFVGPGEAADAPPDLPTLPAGVSEEYASETQVALGRAGPNATELIKALAAAPREHLAAVSFLIANMPDRDLQSLSAAYLLENTALAFEARAAMPWGPGIPEEIFLNDVLPYAVINERRDAWRKDFYAQFKPLLADCRTAGDAAMKLNREVFPLLKVRYHATKRPKADQSPHESIEAGYASCTGLSVLLVDACRAVCVPARLAGIPQWPNQEGNHSWVEVWDRQWYFTGAAEPDPAGLNHAGFVGSAAEADSTNPMTGIYATSFRRTELSFPLVWDLSIKYVSARDVTRYYTARRPVRLRVLEEPGGSPVAARVVLRVGGELFAADVFRPEADMVHLALQLPTGLTYEAEITPASGQTLRRWFTPTEDEREFDLPLRLAAF